MIDISTELLHKYNVQGPRYTSYPPAPSWKTDVTAADYDRHIRDSNQTLRPLSLYVHLPFCEKLCYFCACTTLITGKNRKFEAPYLSSLKKEIKWVASRLDKKRQIIQFHFGGGTPTYSSPEDLAGLMDEFHRHFSFDAGAEVGIEVDPRVTTPEHLTTLRKKGFNRISMGVQDFDDKVQEAVNRVQPYDMTKQMVEDARALGYTSINIDLIYGLPHQTPDSFQATIEKILTINPDRLAVYSYAHVPWLKERQDLFEKHLPGEAQKFEIFKTALRLFTQAGFEYIGMDHFAKPNDELAVARKKRTLWRNFMGYTTKAGTDLFGLGVSAIGGFHDSYFQNQREVPAYEQALEKNGAATMRGFFLSKDDRIRNRVIQNLLCHAVVVKSEIEKEFEIKFDAYFSESLAALRPCIEDGLVEVTAADIRPTELGRVFLRNLAMPFDKYLPKPGEKKIFSRTV